MPIQDHDRVYAALTNFSSFTGEVVEFAAAGFASFNIGNSIHNFGRTLGFNKLGERNTPRHQNFVVALTLIAAWGALEACIEDFCKAAITTDPTLAQRTEIAKLKITADTLFLSEEEKVNILYQAVQTARGTRNGIDQFESTLKYIGMDGGSPHGVSEAIYRAQKIRNIWAHKKGIADKRFTTEAAQLGFSEGDDVIIPVEDFIRYINAMITYATVVVNRYLTQKGLQTAGLNAMEGNVFREQYASFYGLTTEGSAPST